MGTEENNNNLRDEFDSRQFEINEENWKKLVPQLDKADKKRKRRFFFYFVFAGAALLTGSLLILKHEETNDTLTQNNADIHAPAVKKDLFDVQKNSNTGPGSKNSSFSKNDKENNITIETGGHIQESLTKKENVLDEIKNENKSKKKKEIRAGQYNKGAHTFSNEGKMAVTVSKKLNPISTKKKENNLFNAQEIIKDAPGEKEYFDKLSNQKGKETINQPGSIAIKNEEPLLNSNDSLAAGTDSVPAAVSKKDSVASILINKNTVNQNDSVPKKPEKPELFASAYLAFTPGYGGPISLKESFNPSVGLGIRKFFNPKIGIGTGLYYTIYGNITNTPKIYQSTIQDFGYTNSVTEIRQTKTHYIKLPITLELRLKENIFSIGTEIMYLLTSSANVKTYNESFGTVSDETFKKEYGYVQGFSNYDIAALLSYSRRISRKFYFNMLFNMGFIDVKMNSYFNSQTFDRNRSVQIGTSYKF